MQNVHSKCQRLSDLFTGKRWDFPFYLHFFPVLQYEVSADMGIIRGLSSGEQPVLITLCSCTSSIVLLASI